MGPIEVTILSDDVVWLGCLSDLAAALELRDLAILTLNLDLGNNVVELFVLDGDEGTLGIGPELEVVGARVRILLLERGSHVVAQLVDKVRVIFVILAINCFGDRY